MEAYLNPNLGFKERAADLVSRMSTEEKIEQICRKVYHADGVTLTPNAKKQAALLTFDDMVLRETLNRFLRALDEEKRNIFIRRYWYLDSIADISRRFGLSQSKVKTVLFRCRSGLREHLEKEGYVL